MLQRILRKRTSVEIQAFQVVRDLMPRGRKTRGIQYETLEFLFEHLYERVPETLLRDHLLQVKGHLQRTGDPVKGAINQAVKELQRLPEALFEIVKFQRATFRGQCRYVQMNFTRFEEVIAVELFAECLRDVLKKEERIVVRGISHRTQENPTDIFPGLTYDDLARCRAHFLINPVLLPRPPENIVFHYIPESPANLQLVLVYEERDPKQPFLALLARSGRDIDDEGQEFILYRGMDKYSELKFLDRIWHDLARRAVNEEDMKSIRRQVREMAGGLAGQGNDWHDMLLNGLVARAGSPSQFE